MIKKFFIAPLRAYQYISRLTPANCRYYPTCSQYAAWHFDNSPTHIALMASTLRILRCNQLFDGGIDYPISSYSAPPIMMLQNEFFITQKAYISLGTCKIKPFYGRIKILYWRVPIKNKYAIIKDFDDSNPQKST